MTSAVLVQAPLAAGGAAAAALGRTLLRGLGWSISRYARAPISNTAIIALAGVSLMASANAMFLQEHAHPAPLFAPATSAVAEVAPVPVAPSLRPRPVAALPVVQTTGSVPVPTTVAGPISNDEVAALQIKLKALGLLDGAADGFYGPKTASAIRRFEERAGLPPRGELTREVLAAVQKAPMSAVTPSPAAPATVEAERPPAQPAPTVIATTTTAPGPAVLPAHPGVTPLAPEDEASVRPLPAPDPLPAVVQAAHTPAPTVRPLPQDANEVLEIAGGVAGNAVDALVAAVNGDLQMGPAQPMPPKAGPAEPAANAFAAGADSVEGGADPVAELVTASMEKVPTVPADTPVNDPGLVAKVQRGLASLGFLRGNADGVPSEATAKAIRNFEVWNNYDVTGRVSPQLLDLLVAAGAEI